MRRRKSPGAKRLDGMTRKVLRARILRVLRESGAVVIAGRLTLRDEVVWRVAALVRELEETR